MEIQSISAVQMLYDATNASSSILMLDVPLGPATNCRGYPKNSTNKYFRDNGTVPLHADEFVCGITGDGVGAGDGVVSSCRARLTLLSSIF